MNTTGQMGAAVGYAASLCTEYKASPRDIYNNYPEELKDLIINSSRIEYLKQEELLTFLIFCLQLILIKKGGFF